VSMEKLDRVLMSPSLDNSFPMVQIKRLVSDMSDLSPFLLVSGDCKGILPKNCEFQFYLASLKHEELLHKVGEVWRKHVRSSDPIYILNEKLDRFKRHF
jgi:hypothetical protein